MHAFNEPVSALLRVVAAEVVLPRFRNLIAHQVTEKSPGEVVTIADHESEERLHAGLDAMGLDARVLGEEAAAHDPALLSDITEGRLWIIDPIDGTANFAAGNGPFGLMVALVEDGETQAGWLYDPLADRMCHAHRGVGAFVDGRRLNRAAIDRETPIAALATQFMLPEVAKRIRDCAAQDFELVPIPRCAAEHYPRLALGENDVAMFQRTLPWDHAAGALFLTEAGGRVTRWNGSCYRVGDDGIGIVAGRTPELWERAMRVLGCAEAGFARA